MPNKFLTIVLVALGLAVAATAAAFAQAANAPPTPLARDQAATDPVPPGMAQKRQAEAQDKQVQQRAAQNGTRDAEHPAIGPATTQGLAQDAITRSTPR
jgi:hypothetical protein